MTAEVLSIKPATKARTSKAKAQAPNLTRTQSRHHKRALAKERAATIGLMVVGGLILALGVTYLADGIYLMTGANPVMAWSTALGFDAGIIMAEACTLFAVGEKKKRDVAKLAHPMIYGLLVLSAALNVAAHMHHAPEGMLYQMTAAALGVAIPALYLGISRLGARMVK